MSGSATRNIRLYPWFRFAQALLFWQAIWFLYFQSEMSAAEAILLYAVFDVSATALEVPLGYMSDRIGRRITLILSGLSGGVAAWMMAVGSGFEIYAAANVLLGAWAALNSGTDSAFLYESLVADEREAEIEAHELKAWRYSFVAYAVSAVLGGVMYMYGGALPYYAVTVMFFVSAYIAFLFHEVSAPAKPGESSGVHDSMQAITSTLRNPVLMWIFVLSLLMYIFSHLPFIFGQPFILEALATRGLDGNAPIVSGIVTATMMGLSVIVSLFAPKLRRWMGLSALLLVAFSMQIALVGILALTSSVIAIGFLFLRMVPDSLSKPFILARIQPELRNASRATYLSLQSFCGRLLFAASLYLASGATSDQGQMVHSEIRTVLGWYVALGAFSLICLAVAARRVRIETNKTA